MPGSRWGGDEFPEAGLPPLSHEALLQQSLPVLLVGASGLAGLGTRVGLVVGTFGLVALSRMRGSQMVLFEGWILDLQVGRQDQGTWSFRNQ